MDSRDNTAVFDFGDLSRVTVHAEPEADYAAAEPIVHRDNHKGHSGRMAREILLFLGSACALIMVVLSLLGQARLTAMSREAVAISQEITELEETARRQMTESVPLAYGQSSVSSAAPDNVDHAEVLHVRTGSRILAGWRTVVDTFEAYFP